MVYVNCAGCGNLHDRMEGGYISDDENKVAYFVCLDCADEPDQAKRLQILQNARKNQKGSAYFYDMHERIVQRKNEK